MKNKLTRKLMLSAFTLLFAVISLGASTYAWFTLSGDAEIKTFEGQVTGGAGLEIQVLKTGTEINSDKWQTSIIESNLIADVLGDVTLDAVTTSAKDSFDGTFKTLNSDNPSGWIQFDLAFRLSDQSNTKIYNLYFDGYTLTTDENTVSPWRVNKAYYDSNANLKSLNSTPSYYVSDAARLGITTLDKGYLTDKVSPVCYQAADGSDEYTEGVPTETQTLTVGEEEITVVKNGAFNYYNEVNPTAPLNINDAPTYTCNKAVGTETNGYKIGQLVAKEVVRITVFVWVEGWDAECINAIFKQTLQATLSFYLDINGAVEHTHNKNGADNSCTICGEKQAA